jgi:hydrogenase-4 component F
VDGTLSIAALLSTPALGAAVALALRNPRHVLAWTAAWVAAYLAVAWAAALAVFAEGPADAASGWLFLDALSAFHLVSLSIVFGLSTAFAFFYFGREVDAGKLQPRIARRFGALWASAVLAMTLVLVSDNLAIMWVAVELTTLATAFLIRLHVTQASLEATWKYLVVCSVGLSLAFLGVVLFASSARGVVGDGAMATSWRALVASAAGLDAGQAKAGFLFVLVGFGTKAGLAPMHTWLPDAHSQAPSPVSALFSGALLNVALYAVMRYLPVVEGATGSTGWGRGLLLGVGLFSVLIAAAFIAFQQDVKRLLAYSSVEHLGIIAVGLGLGPAGTFAALFHTLNHGASKSAAFLAAGRLSEAYGGSQIARMGGAARAHPLWGGALVVSLLALVGAAPFALFVSEFLVIQAAAAAGAWAALGLLLFGLGVVFAGAMRHAVFVGWGPEGAAGRPLEGTRAEAALVLLPLGLVALLGVYFPPALRDAIEQAARAVGGGG